MEERLRKKFNIDLVISISFLLIGLFLLIKPDITISIISYTIGGVLLLSGVYSCYKYFTFVGIENIFNFNLVYGVLLVIASMFMFIKPNALATLFPIILGIWIIVNSVTKFQYALLLRKAKEEDFVYTIVISVLTFLWGVVLLINPFESVLTITKVIGVFIIIYAVLDIVDNIIIRRNLKRVLELLEK